MELRARIMRLEMSSSKEMLEFSVHTVHITTFIR